MLEQRTALVRKTTLPARTILDQTSRAVKLENMTVQEMDMFWKRLGNLGRDSIEKKMNGMFVLALKATYRNFAREIPH